MNEAEELTKKLREQCVSDPVSLHDYFAAKEATQPPEAFWQAECPGSGQLRKPNGQIIPQPLPEPPKMAEVIAKWRFLCADAMVAESKKRSE